MTASRLPIVAFILTLSAGCASSVSLERTTIPQPHVEKIPVNVALRIPDEFHNFVHEENVLGRESWSIELGSANAEFFQQLFGYMFNNVIVLAPEDDALDHTFDALVEPKIEGFEFSVPNQSKSDEFAVWIRYRLQIYDSLGNDAGVWTVSAYGKSQKEGMGGSDSLRRAAVLAMRDAAALMLLQMDKSTQIRALADGPIGDAPGPAYADNDQFQGGGIGVFAIGGIDDEDQ